MTLMYWRQDVRCPKQSSSVILVSVVSRSVMCYDRTWCWWLVSGTLSHNGHRHRRSLDELGQERLASQRSVVHRICSPATAGTWRRLADTKRVEQHRFGVFPGSADYGSSS